MNSVLIVDDDQQILRLLARGLKNRCDVTRSDGVSDALQLFGTGARFDVIICDLMLADGTAVDLHQKLRALYPEQSDRMVLMSGMAPESTAGERFARQGILLKPFTTGELAATIDGVVARQGQSPDVVRGDPRSSRPGGHRRRAQSA